MIGMGTLVNISAVVAGSLLGMFFHGGLKVRFQETLMQALGLCTMFVGAAASLKGLLVINNGTLETSGTMLMILSLVTGAFLGEWMNVEKGMEQFGEWIKSRIKGKNNPQFVEGFVTSSLVICVGAMAVVGSLQDGLIGDASMLYTKSLLDLIIVMVFATTLGNGVLFSAIPLGLFQGSITLFARLLAPVLTDSMISNLSFVGSVLIFGVGVNIAFGKKFKVGNMLPALIMVVIITLLSDVFR